MSDIFFEAGGCVLRQQLKEKMGHKCSANSWPTAAENMFDINLSSEIVSDIFFSAVGPRKYVRHIFLGVGERLPDSARKYVRHNLRPGFISDIFFRRG